LLIDKRKEKREKRKEISEKGEGIRDMVAARREKIKKHFGQYSAFSSLFSLLSFHRIKTGSSEPVFIRSQYN
jgi:hypothetical protein